MLEILTILLAAGLIYLTTSAMARMFRSAMHPHGHHRPIDPPDPPEEEAGGA